MELRLAESQTASQQAVEAVDRVRRRDLVAGVTALIGIIIAVVALAIGLHAIIDATNARVDTTNARIDQIVIASPPPANAPTAQQLDQLNARLCKIEIPSQQVIDHCPSPSPTP
jgi:hypothetical protein